MDEVEVEGRHLPLAHNLALARDDDFGTTKHLAKVVDESVMYGSADTYTKATFASGLSIGMALARMNSN